MKAFEPDAFINEYDIGSPIFDATEVDLNDDGRREYIIFNTSSFYCYDPPGCPIYVLKNIENEWTVIGHTRSDDIQVGLITLDPGTMKDIIVHNHDLDDFPAFIRLRWDRDKAVYVDKD